MSIFNELHDDKLQPIVATEWLVRIGNCSYPRSVEEEATKFFLSLGVDAFSYRILSIGKYETDDDENLKFSRLSTEWISEYDSKGYFAYDPILATARRSAGPFRWSEISQLVQLDERQNQYLERLNDFFFQGGWAMPVFGPLEIIGYFGISSMIKNLEFSQQDILLIQAVCNCIHLRMFEVSDNKELIIRVSERKRQILILMSKGNSKPQIARILGISVHTVDAYTRRIYALLDANNNVEAVVKAMQLGIIKHEKDDD